MSRESTIEAVEAVVNVESDDAVETVTVEVDMLLSMLILIVVNAEVVLKYSNSLCLHYSHLTDLAKLRCGSESREPRSVPSGRTTGAALVIAITRSSRGTASMNAS